MLTGSVLGALIMALIFIAVFLKGKEHSATALARGYAEENRAIDQKYRELTVKVQELVKPNHVSFKDDQIVLLANMVILKVEEIYIARQNAALNKLD